MDFYVTSPVDYPAYRQLFRLSVLKQRRIFMALFVVMAAVLGYSLADSYNRGVPFPVSYLVFTVFLYVLMPLTYFLMPGLMFRALPDTPDNRYHFKENGFSVIQGETAMESREVPYDSLFRIYETGYGFYLYLTKQQSFAVRRQDMADGDAETLSARLGRCGKYKKRK